jgi:triacylglycerol esterase/lipase EstA (alpha/beta hydrolase family)
MGGLALRRWWVAHGQERNAGQPRVQHAITIGTPHHGTWLARFAFTSNGRQMRCHSEWLQALHRMEQAGGEGPPWAGRMTCFYGHCDNIAFPASNATLAGADNRHLSAVAHVHMADRPEPFDALQALLAEPFA